MVLRGGVMGLRGKMGFRGGGIGVMWELVMMLSVYW